MEDFFVQSYKVRRHIFVSFSGWRLRVSRLALSSFHYIDRSCAMLRHLMPNALFELWTHNELGWTTHLWILINIREVRAALLIVFNHVTRRSIVAFTLTIKKSHNSPCLLPSLPLPKFFSSPLFSSSPGYCNRPKRNWKHIWYSYKFLWSRISCILASSLDHGQCENCEGKKNSQNL